MAKLDPEFAKPLVYRQVAASLALYGSPEWIRDDIAAAEEDIRTWEDDIRRAQEQIPELEREVLTKQRDIAVAKLKMHELRAKLAAKEGGAQ